MVFGVMRDKAVQEMAEILFPIAEHVIVTHANNPRSASPDEIRQAAVARGGRHAYREAADVASALERGRQDRRPRRAGGGYRFDLHCGRGDAKLGDPHLRICVARTFLARRKIARRLERTI